MTGSSIRGMTDAIKGFFEVLLSFMLAMGLLLLLAALGSSRDWKVKQEKTPEQDKTPACCQVTVNLQTTNEITPPVITRRPCPPPAATTDKKPATTP